MYARQHNIVGDHSKATFQDLGHVDVDADVDEDEDREMTSLSSVAVFSISHQAKEVFYIKPQRRLI